MEEMTKPTALCGVFVRKEYPGDYDKVYQLIKEAFAGAAHSDGNEQDLVVRLRRSPAFIPELSLVAEFEGQVVGHILFTRLKAGDTEQLALAPLSVAPAFQCQGVGSLLVREGHKAAKKLGYVYSVVIGYPLYYSRFGYMQAGRFGLRAPFELPEDVFMACPLQEEMPLINAPVEYPSEFFEK